MSASTYMTSAAMYAAAYTISAVTFKALMTNWTRPIVRYLFNSSFISTTYTSSQGTSSGIVSHDGFRLPIRLPIITMHARLITAAQLNGFLKEAYSINGNLLGPSCGYTENVRLSWPSPRVRLLIISEIRSGIWEKYTLVCPSSTFSFLVKLTLSI